VQCFCVFRNVKDVDEMGGGGCGGGLTIKGGRRAASRPLVWFGPCTSPRHHHRLAGQILGIFIVKFSNKLRTQSSEETLVLELPNVAMS